MLLMLRLKNKNIIPDTPLYIIITLYWQFYFYTKIIWALFQTLPYQTDYSPYKTSLMRLYSSW